MASWSVRFRGFISVPCASCKMEVHPSHPKLDNFRFETYGFGMFWWSPILRNTHLMMNLRWGTHSIAMAQNDLPLNSDRPASSTALRIQYSHSPLVFPFKNPNSWDSKPEFGRVLDPKDLRLTCETSLESALLNSARKFPDLWREREAVLPCLGGALAQGGPSWDGEKAGFYGWTS